MRVIAGTYGGRTLQAPPGRTTRPTTDRMKESMISALLSLHGSFDGAYVLDAFAGSGALGIECISRGAAHVDFFENGSAFATLKKNISTLGIESLAHLHRSDVFAVTSAQTPYDILLFDPPYATDQSHIWGIVEVLANAHALKDHVSMVYEHAAKDELYIPDSLAAMCVITKTRSFGEAAFSLIDIDTSR